MRISPLKQKMRTARQFRGKRVHLARLDAQAVHARINFQVKARPKILFPPRRPSSSSFKLLQLLEPRNSRRQIMPQQNFFLAGPKSSKHQNPFPNPSLAQLNPFARASNPQPFHPSLSQRLRNRHRPQPISISLNHRQNLPPPPNVPPNNFQVMQNISQRNLSPNRPSIKFDLTSHGKRRSIRQMRVSRGRTRIGHQQVQNLRVSQQCRHGNGIQAQSMPSLASAKNARASPYSTI